MFKKIVRLLHFKNEKEAKPQRLEAPAWSAPVFVPDLTLSLPKPPGRRNNTRACRPDPRACCRRRGLPQRDTETQQLYGTCGFYMWVWGTFQDRPHTCRHQAPRGVRRKSLPGLAADSMGTPHLFTQPRAARLPGP